ncbi:MAG TPA: efflux RND transporter periplasmic adaptor subunit [Saprospiraceae bacterium]|nr:efflux RND transporter periplasmic adaptor subunit [Saprospiraceae bacterium]
MKNIKYLILAVALIASACQPQVSKDSEVPQGLEEKKELLVEKRAALKTLTEEVEELEREIAELDPNIAPNRSLVTTIPIEKEVFERYTEIQGNVASALSAAAAAEVGGRVKNITVEEGDRVREGQLIAELDLEQINKQMAELDKSLELAEEVFARQERLWKQNIGSEIQYLEAENNVERLRKSMETLEFQLTKSKVYAPISGVVDVVNLEPGELASPGVPIVAILSTSRLQVVADLSENYLQTVKRGDRVLINYPSINYEQEARISLIGSTIDPANRTFKVEVNTGNPGGRLKPNLLAVLKVKEYEQEDAIVLPLSLIQQEVGGQKYVMVVEEGDEALLARKVYVTTGESYDGNVIITSGLEGDEQIINRGARGLSEGDPLEISKG